VKGPEAFRTISEAATELGVPQHVLRFWETKFSFIRPMKRAGGRRFYRRQDIEVLRAVRTLLHDNGYTIKGVQRLHKEHGVRHLVEAAPTAAPDDSGSATPPPMRRPVLGEHARSRLTDVLDDLEATKIRLDALLRR
jgi:DNA-binding transcriptional MerR regulator